MANKFLRPLREESLFPDEDDVDVLKALLVSLLMKDTCLDKEVIYTYIFGKGKNILWH